MALRVMDNGASGVMREGKTGTGARKEGDWRKKKDGTEETDRLSHEVPLRKNYVKSYGIVLGRESVVEEMFR